MALRCPMIIAALALLGVIAAPVAAQDRKEFWPELDVWYTLNPRTRLLFVGATTRNRDGDKTDTEASLYVDYRENRHHSWRLGYSYLTGLPTQEGDSKKIERRVAADFVALFWLARDWTLFDRNRIDIRYVGTDSTSLRYRNRLRVEGIQRIRREQLTPYASVEAYVDEGDAAVDRWRAEIGVDIPVTPQFVPSLYWGWQTDAKPKRETLVGFGVTLTFVLR